MRQSLLRACHVRQCLLRGRVGASELDLGRPGLPEGFFPKELDRAEGLGVKPRGGHAPLRGGGLPGELLFDLEVKEVLAAFLGSDQVGRFAEELAEFHDAGPVTQDGAFGQREQTQIVEVAI